jgi:hypothetical protein
MEDELNEKQRAAFYEIMAALLRVAEEDRRDVCNALLYANDHICLHCGGDGGSSCVCRAGW